MPIRVECPNPKCKKTLEAPDTHAGKKARCPGCGHIITIPEPDTVLVEAGADPLVRSKLGHLEIKEKLGQGGMGAVYLGVNTSLDRMAAVKVLPEELVKDNPAFLDRFLREARMAAKLNHPNAVTVYFIGEDKGRHFIEMEFVQGMNLRQVIQKQGRVELKEASRIITDAARALAAAHEQGIVHRDIKPDNIMLTEKGEVKVADFGLARISTADSSITMSGQVVGTPLYMSPEQGHGKPTDGRTDIYSLGATYYHALVGSVPFTGDTPLQVMMKHVHDPISWPEGAEDIPPDIRVIIEKMMAKNPEDRYQTCGEVIKAIEEYFKPKAVVARAVTVATATPVRPGAAIATPPKSAYVISAEDLAGLESAARDLRRSTPKKKMGTDLPSGLSPFSSAKMPKWFLPVVALALLAIVVSVVVGITVSRRGGEEKRSATDGHGLTRIEEQKPEVRSRKTEEDVSRMAAAPQRREGDVVSRPEAKEFTFWKFIAPHVPVQGTGGNLQSLPAGQLWDVKYMPDGKGLAVAHAFGVDLWDSRKSVVLRRLDGHTREVTAIDLSMDGSRLISVSADASAIVWETASGKTMCKRAVNPKAPYTAVALSPGGRVAATCDGASVCLWNADTGEDLRVITGHGAAVRCCAFSPDGTRIASGSEDKTVRLWDVAKGTEMACLEGHTAAVTHVVFSRDGQLLASSGWDAAVRIWELKANKTSAVLNVPGGAVCSLSFSRDGSILAAGERGFRVWDWRKNSELARVQAGHCIAIDLDPDGKTLISARLGGMPFVEIYDARTGRKLDTIVTHGWRRESVEFSPAEPRLILSGTQGGSWTDLTDVQSGKEIRRWSSGVGGVMRPTFSKEGSKVGLFQYVYEPNSPLSSGLRATVFDANTGKSVCVLDECPKGAGCLVFSPDNDHVAYRYDEKTIKVRMLSDPKKVVNIAAPDARCLTFCPDGKALAGACGDKTVRLWSALAGAEIRSLNAGDGSDVVTLASSPDGRLLASGHANGIIHLWDIQADAPARPLRSLTGHKSRVSWLSFSPDGEEIASSSHDRTVRLWAAKTGQEAQVLTEHRDIVLGVAFSPDGRYLASASGDGTIGLWQRAEKDGAKQPSAPSALSAGKSYDDIYVTESAAGDKIPHPLSKKTVKMTHDGKEVAVPEGMVYVPEGAFIMGEGDSKHEVYLDAYFIGKYEVTNAEWKTFCETTGFSPLPKHWVGGRIPEGKENHPVVYVSWEDAQKYCEWVKEKTGWEARLPTEAEWEKAASWDPKNRQKLIFPWGNSWDAKLCNSGYNLSQFGFRPSSDDVYYKILEEFQTKNVDLWKNLCDGDGNTVPVGSYPKGATVHGCMDMAGNVWEWCNDWFRKDYFLKEDAKKNPHGPSEDEAEAVDFSGKNMRARLLRGGSWNVSSRDCRTMYRRPFSPSFRYNTCGFRVVLSVRALK